MATSVCVLKYGLFTFSPVPQIGIRSNGQPGGESSKNGPFNRERIVTLQGYLRADSYNALQTKVAALEAALILQNQTFYWHDGTTLRSNIAAQVLSFDIPVEWGQYEARYTITLSYFPLDDGNTAPFAVSYNGHTFDPVPLFGREMQAQRQSEDASRDSTKVTVSLTGFIESGTMSGNKAILDAMITAFAGDGTLVYGDYTQTVKFDRFSHSPDTTQRRVAYSVSFFYFANLTGGANNIKKLSSSRSIRSGQRIAKHYVPFLHDASIQLLGRESQIITATGYVICTTIAGARVAAFDEIASLFPVGGHEESREITEFEDECKIQWNVVAFYPTPVLTGGVYGDFD